MAFPTRNEQIKHVADWLADPGNEERTAEELAKILVNGMYDLWAKGLKDPPLIPHLGTAFKVPFLSAVHFVAWKGEEFGKEKIWVTNATSDFGFLTNSTSSLWTMAAPSSAKAGAPGTNSDGWEPSQHVSLSQRRTHLTILQVGLKGVLMRDDSNGALWAESNANMKKYYQKESK